MNPNYIIITPVYNEQDYIAKTIETVAAQTTLPRLWIIVDDDSTDGTAEIIKPYAEQYPWIQYHLRRKDPSQTYYASNVYAIREGFRQIQKTDYDYLAILDGDISLPKDYYEQIIGRMESNDQLGIASGVYVDNVNGTLRKVLNDRRSNPKALMVFRRSCYEAIGGFVSMKYGGEDTIACFSARMKGYKTWSFPDVVAIHNKPAGMGHSSHILKIRFRQGINEYFLAMHFIFFMLKSLRRCFKEFPFLIGGLARITGYCYAGLCMGQKRQIPDDLVRYIRREQWQRICHGNKIEKTVQEEASDGK